MSWEEWVPDRYIGKDEMRSMADSREIEQQKKIDEKRAAALRYIEAMDGKYYEGLAPKEIACLSAACDVLEKWFDQEDR